MLENREDPWGPNSPVNVYFSPATDPKAITLSLESTMGKGPYSFSLACSIFWSSNDTTSSFSLQLGGVENMEALELSKLLYPQTSVFWSVNWSSIASDQVAVKTTGGSIRKPSYRAVLRIWQPL